MEQKPASELKISDLGRMARSDTYWNKNKTAKPRPNPTNYVVETIYAHRNGNILINNGIYLRSDTIITFLD